MASSDGYNDTTYAWGDTSATSPQIAFSYVLWKESIISKGHLDEFVTSSEQQNFLMGQYFLPILAMSVTIFYL